MGVLCALRLDFWLSSWKVYFSDELAGYLERIVLYIFFIAFVGEDVVSTVLGWETCLTGQRREIVMSVPLYEDLLQVSIS